MKKLPLSILIFSIVSFSLMCKPTLAFSEELGTQIAVINPSDPPILTKGKMKIWNCEGHVNKQYTDLFKQYIVRTKQAMTFLNLEDPAICTYQIGSGMDDVPLRLVRFYANAKDVPESNGSPILMAVKFHFVQEGLWFSILMADNSQEGQKRGNNNFSICLDARGKVESFGSDCMGIIASKR